MKFFSRLLDKVEAEPALQEEGKRFVFSVTDLLERLLDYRETMDREEQRDTKMHCTFNILERQATFLGKILEGTKLRQDPSYYRVAYYGNTFPPYVKNKAFIYRGDECLQLSTLMNQLTTEYPAATILTSNQPPSESVKQGDAQYIQIVSVKPVPRERSEFLGRDVPSEIAAFYQTNEVDTFKFDRPYHRDDKDKNNEFKSLCLERTVMISSYKLPGILRWYEVSSTSITQLNPVQTAMDTVHMMNKELRTSSANAATDPEQCLRHLSMRLQGVISGAVNGGIPKYQEAFFNEEYISKYPEERPYIDQLRSAILEQLEVLNNGLTLQGKLAGPELKPLHHSLLDLYNKMRNNMGYHAPRNRGSILSTESHGRSTPSSQSFNSSDGGSNRSSVASAADVNIADETEDNDNIYIQAPDAYCFPPLLSPHLAEVSNASRRCSSLRSLPSPAGLQPPHIPNCGRPKRPLSAHIVQGHSGPPLRHHPLHLAHSTNHLSPKCAVPMYSPSATVPEPNNNIEDNMEPPAVPPRKKSIGGGSLSGVTLNGKTQPELGQDSFKRGFVASPEDIMPVAPPVPARKFSNKSQGVTWPDTQSSTSPGQPALAVEDNGPPEVPPQIPSKRATIAPILKSDLSSSSSSLNSPGWASSGSSFSKFSRTTSVMSNSSTSSKSSGSGDSTTAVRQFQTAVSDNGMGTSPPPLPPTRNTRPSPSLWFSGDGNIETESPEFA
ncbi:dedicator of cytokinesis protein 3-like [Elysia marginata]|uniref:Dedicator of cytokinesis protein 3-like n=1 Tax=Elysia marginata TaxID=1093978 RepID=A0AAV4FIK8_9GAST|nr:dedicator of cytokinesis protein 3-like [Elysia marginata]